MSTTSRNGSTVRSTKKAKRATAYPAWRGPTHPVVTALKAIFLIFVVIVMAYPLIYVVGLSFATAKGIAENPFFPTEFTLDAYKTILGGSVVPRSIFVSVGVTVVGTLLSVIFTTTLAYGLSRSSEVPGTRICVYLAFFTMLFSAGLIPTYLLVKELGMLNSLSSLVVPTLISAFNLVVIRNFFMELPSELFESARIDGASEWRIFSSIVLPLSKAPIAVIALFYAVGYWNNYFSAMLYIQDTSKWPIQLVLNQYVLQDSPMTQLAANPMAAPPPAQSVQMAVLVLATAPILLVYPFAQKHFTKGVLTGAIKG